MKKNKNNAQVHTADLTPDLLIWVLMSSNFFWYIWLLSCSYKKGNVTERLAKKEYYVIIINYAWKVDLDLDKVVILPVMYPYSAITYLPWDDTFLKKACPPSL